MLIRVKGRIININNVADICIGQDWIVFYFNTGVTNRSIIANDEKDVREVENIKLACVEFKRVSKITGKMPYNELLTKDFDDLKKYLETDSEIERVC
jgi:hypothetical protein